MSTLVSESPFFVQRFINTGATVRGRRFVKRTALVTDGNGQSTYSIEEATDGVLAGGTDIVEGVVMGSKNESLTPTTTRGEAVSVVNFGPCYVVAGAVMDPATVEHITFDNQGRATAATVATHRRVGRLIHHAPTVAGELCLVFLTLANAE